ncbi:MAG: galactose mutarotase [Phycisphaerales bacterium]|nr:galactose mutarotase [Phycisphaerales bacterium]
MRMVLLASLVLLTGCSMSGTEYGSVDGAPVRLYTLTNDQGTIARITNYGAIVTEFHVADREGHVEDVALGFDAVADYVDRSPYFGAMVGRCANRIANGRFELDGTTYTLATNNGPNHLHGGVVGWDKVIWKATPRTTELGQALELTYHSPDGEEGYPGAVDVTVVYTLTYANELRVDIEATTDKATPLNVAHHTYWNLAGHDSGSILDHEVRIVADRYTPADATLIPTGELAPVEGTPYDLRSSTRIRDVIGGLPPSGDDPGGYDVNYVVATEVGTMRLAATVRDPASGRVMDIFTTEPGLQFYTGNFLDGIEGKDGAVYDIHEGFCLETQRFPDAINKEGRTGWPSAILRPGETYRHTMVHRFRID